MITKVATSRSALCASIAAALLAACGGSHPPIGALGAMPHSREIAQRAARGGSWILPEAKNEGLVYLSASVGRGGGNVYILSYTTGKWVGTLTGFHDPSGLCVDKSGNVWVVNTVSEEVDEYAHGGTTRIGSLTVPGPAALGCAVDPATGNLAVTYNYHWVAVYAGAQGTPVTYTDDYGLEFFFCTYDNSSNLFISDAWGYEKPSLYELPNGSSGLTEISFNTTIHFNSSNPLTIQWDGTTLAFGGIKVAPKGFPTVYQLSVSGGEAKVLGTTHLLNHRPLADGGPQFWVQDKSLVRLVSDQRIGIWNYPGGGDPKRLFKTPVRGTVYPGIAVSVAPSR